ncbi:MAG TPA: Fic family protein [Acidobacteriaceae bacterium]|nr:Fic family protein [Acidobacteriaceae bacterium]
MRDIKNIIITPEILKLIAEIDEFKGCWKVIETLAPEKLTSLRRIATIESVGSSTRIEGSKLSDVEVEKLLSGLQTKSFASRDEEEVAGYADAMDMIFEGYEVITATENHIKQLHGVLLKYSSKDQDHRGEYKKVTNHVEAFGPDGKSLGVVFETATPFETPGWMKEIVDWFNQFVQEESHHPLILVGIFIVVFLAIHPFKDGNGRLSRILTTLLLLRAGYGYVPYSSMEGVIEQNKDSYYLALRRTQQTIRKEEQNWEAWLVFFLKTMVKQKDNLAAKMKEEQALRASLPALSRQILELVKTRGEITVKEIEDSTGANRNTIKVHLKKLAEQHYLVQVGKGRGARYTIK